MTWLFAPYSRCREYTGASRRTCRERNCALCALCDVAITDISWLIQIAFRYGSVSRRGIEARLLRTIIQRSRTALRVIRNASPDMSRAGSSASYKKFTVQRPRIFQLATAHCLTETGARRKSVDYKVIMPRRERVQNPHKNYGLADYHFAGFSLLSIAFNMLLKSVNFNAILEQFFSEIFDILPHWRWRPFSAVLKR